MSNTPMISTARLDELDAQVAAQYPTTARCVLCPDWVVSGSAEECLAAGKQHRLEHGLSYKTQRPSVPHRVSVDDGLRAAARGRAAIVARSLRDRGLA